MGHGGSPIPHPAHHPRGAHQLPPGRHGLSRSFVARNQRERILVAVAEVASAHGYRALNVRDVVTRAGVSRRTFYELFPNKEAAFLAAYDEGAGRLLSLVRAAYGAELTFPDRVAAGFRVFLDLLVASPAFARMCIVEVMAAGPDAISRRNWVMSEFALLLEVHARELLGEQAPSPLVAETVIGGIYEAVYRRVANGELSALPALLPDIVESALLPYVGERMAKAQRSAVLVVLAR